jgi:excisionase family DNA binding protein
MRGESEWLTTGEAARLCSVERDTVLKWIKRGRIPAARTAGGHYRISSQDLERLLAPLSWRRSAGTGQLVRSLRCWEYLAVAGKIRDECRGCLAFQVGAAWCFRLRQREREAGFFCCGPKSCEQCPYYRRIAGLPTRVLAVTEDEQLRRDLASAGPSLSVTFARNAYEAARAVPEVWPALVVLDGEIGRAGSLDLLESLLSDRAAVGLRVIYAVAGETGRAVAERLRRRGEAVAVLRKPFGVSAIQEILAGLPVEAPPADTGE